jgi:hypothetical protein
MQNPKKFKLKHFIRFSEAENLRQAWKKIKAGHISKN